MVGFAGIPKWIARITEFQKGLTGAVQGSFAHAKGLLSALIQQQSDTVYNSLDPEMDNMRLSNEILDVTQECLVEIIQSSPCSCIFNPNSDPLRIPKDCFKCVLGIQSQEPTDASVS